jgi:uncharacterized protein (TIGR02145 family)
MYNWDTVNTGKLAPTGWHVPTDTEWKTLENYLIANGYNFDLSTQDDYFAKSLAATTNWAVNTDTEGDIGNDLTTNNSTGFSALPGGWRGDGNFYNAGTEAFFWSSSEGDVYTAGDRYLVYNSSNMFRNFGSKFFGYSVRCVRDN